MYKNLKKKLDTKKLKKLEKELSQLREEIPRIQKQLQTGEIPTTSTKGQSHPEIERKLEKPTEKKTGHDKGEESPHATRPDGFRKENTKQIKTTSKENVKKTKRESQTKKEPSLKEVQTTHAMNKRQGSHIAKRCHFCRKRGHIKKNCPIKQKCWNWMKGGSA